MIPRSVTELIGLLIVERNFGFIPGVVGRGHFGHEYFGKTVIVQVGHIGAHGAFAGFGDRLFQYLFKGSVAPVVVQIVAFEKVVGDKQIGQTVAVIISHRNTETKTDGRGIDSGLPGDIRVDKDVPFNAIPTKGR